MQAMVCEMCGSNDIVKQDGLFVCQHCGTKYSLEEAKKLLGTVKLDKSDELSNALKLARRAKSENNSEDAKKYYSDILAVDPNNWEAYFYTRYYPMREAGIMNFSNNAAKLANSINNVFELVKELPESEQKAACEEICSRILDVLKDASRRIGVIGNRNFDSSMSNLAHVQAQGVYSLGITLGDSLTANFDYNDLATSVYKTVLILNAEVSGLSDYERNSVQEKVCSLDPSFTPPTPMPTPEPSTPSKPTGALGGCYVATAVYGSYDCPEVWTLRRYRDYTLAETWLGRLFIALYYAISPSLVKWFGDTQWFRNMWKPKLDKMVERLNREGVADTPYQDRQW